MALTRKEQAIRSRQKLLDAAIELITKNGYDSISIVDITSICGMSPGNFYNYFKSKEDIILALEREPYDTYLAELSKATDQPIIGQIRNYIKCYVDLMVNKYGVNFNRQWYTQHMRPMADPSKPTKMEIQVSEFCEILNRGIRMGEIVPNAPVEELAQYITFELQGMNVCHIMSNGSFNAISWTNRFCDFVEDTLLSPYINKK